MPMIPPQPARGGRSCANCACFYELPHPKNPLEKQGFCARQPAMVGQVRMSVPRLDKEGKPVMSRHEPRTPVTDSVEDIAFTHQPTSSALVCMDGWRPVGALPGERATDVRYRLAAQAAQPLLEGAVAAGALPPELAALVMTALGAEVAPPAANDDGDTAAPPPLAS